MRRAVAVAAALLIAGGLVWWIRTPERMRRIEPAGELGPRCDDRDPPAYDRDIALVVARGPGVEPAEVSAQLGRAARYFEPYGVTLLQRGSARALDTPHLMTGSRAALDRALEEEGIDPHRSAAPGETARVRRLTCEIALGPLRRYLEEAGDGPVHVVFLRRIAEPGSPIADMLPDLRGITFGPSTDPQLRDCLDLDEAFPPTVLLGLDAIAARRPGTVDVTLPHELGHVLGLRHTDAADRLMGVEPPRCVPTMPPPP